MCAVHGRYLTWYEAEAGGCFWCDASLIPSTPNRESKGWQRRKDRWDTIRALTPTQHERLLYGSIRSRYDHIPDGDLVDQPDMFE